MWARGHLTQRARRSASRTRTRCRPHHSRRERYHLRDTTPAASESRGGGSELRDAANGGASSGERLGCGVPSSWLESTADVPTGYRHRDCVQSPPCAADGWSGGCMGPSLRSPSVRDASGSTVRKYHVGQYSSFIAFLVCRIGAHEMLPSRWSYLSASSLK